ncbi:MAG: S-layer homology domain-containing protein [Eubacteriales bacterium]
MKPNSISHRFGAGLLAFCLTLGLFPAEFVTASEPTTITETELVSTYEIPATETEGETQFIAQTDLMLSTDGHWSQPYLDRMLAYGFMRPEQIVDPNASLTRADFMAIVNRSFGYTEMGGNPFTDVTTADWFHDDICIAANAGYIAGTTATTAAPHGTLTRETVAFVLGENLMLSDSFGENLTFADGRDVSDWSRTMVKAASEYGIMQGYEDNTFRPKRAVTFGEVAALMLSAIGTPVLADGPVSYGEVMGNVTITQPGTILRDTIIAGDLFISNGIGLGDVILENVTVLGRIVVCGGESEDGTASIVLRHVKAEEMVVDNLTNQIITLRAEGDTYIETTTVSSPAYLEDNTMSGSGLINIVLDAEPGTELDLGGRIKNVTNVTPNSHINVASGTVDTLTIDEKATNATTEISRGAVVKDLNIDVATEVYGDGDITHLDVNAPGAVVEQLPDTVTIRPGITANLAGEDVDSLGAEELSLDPLILSGYPIASDVSPDNFVAIFSVNKPGTVYWAVSPISKGSVTQENLISPPSYASIAVVDGNFAATETNTPISVPIAGLEVGANYYLSAVLVDARGDVSPLKVIAFSTPDNTVPAFLEGFPYMSQVAATTAQVTAMATKTCKLYFVVLTAGAAQPTPAEFISGAALSGSFGDGILDITKNTELTFPVSATLLQEKDYEVHLWLTDADNANYSEVVTLPFTTLDGSPPEFNQIPTASEIKETSVSFTFNLNEDGTVFWIAVPEGTLYPKLKPGTTSASMTEPLNSEYAKLQVSTGSNGGTGSVAGSVAAVQDVMGTFTITGLEKESAYDLYYIARDEAGNYSVEVGKITFNTLDNTAPLYNGIEFTKISDPENPLTNPYAETDIKLHFSEGIKASGLVGGTGQSFLELYSAVVNAENTTAAASARDLLATALEHCFTMYQVVDGSNTEVTVRNTFNHYLVGNDWTIDYRFATVTMNSDRTLTITFPTSANTDLSGLNLGTGCTYYFVMNNIADSSDSENALVPANLYTIEFTTAHAQVTIRDYLPDETQAPYERADNGEALSTYVTPDHGFVILPDTMTKVEDDVKFDILFTPDINIGFDLYVRVRDVSTGVVVSQQDDFSTTSPYPGVPSDYDTKYTPTQQTIIANALTSDRNGWAYLSPEIVGSSSMIYGASGSTASLNKYFLQYMQARFPALNSLNGNYRYEYAVKFYFFKDTEDRTSWNDDLNMKVQVYSGSQTSLNSNTMSGASLISLPADYTILYQPRDIVPPTLTYPIIDAEDVTADLTLQLSHSGSVTYLITPVREDEDGEEPLIQTYHDYEDPANPGTIINGQITSDYVPSAMRPDLTGTTLEQPNLTLPTNFTVIAPEAYVLTNPGVVWGTQEAGPVSQVFNIEGLTPDTLYYAYFVVKGESSDPSTVYIYKFYTTEIPRPIFDTSGYNGVATNATHVDSKLWYILGTQQSSIYQHYSQKFVDLMTTLEGANYLDALATFAGSPYSQNLTVLEALSTAYSSTAFSTTTVTKYDPAWQGYSVFDAYASAALKSDMSERLRTFAGEGAAVAGYGNGGGTGIDYKADIYQHIDHTDTMDATNDYYLFMMAYNILESPNDVTQNPSSIFSYSIAMLARTDNSPPIITGDMDFSVDSNLSGNTSSNTGIDGTLLIQFDKVLYAAASATAVEFFPVVVTTGFGSAFTGTGSFNFVGNLGGTVNLSQTSGFRIEGARAGASGYVDYVALKVEDAKIGSSFILFDGSYRLASSSGNVSERITITLTGTEVTHENFITGETGLTVPTDNTYSYENLKWVWSYT